VLKPASCKLSFSVLCAGVALVISSSADGKGSPVVFHMETDHAKFVPITPPHPAVIVRHPRKHHRYHLMHTD
jgi:hypothetical protein